MPLEKLLKLIQEKNKRKYKKKNLVAEYFISLIMENYNEFKNILGDGQSITENEIYCKIKEMVICLDKKEKSINQKSEYRNDWEISFERQLGWLEYAKRFNAGTKEGEKIDVYCISLTQKGKEILENYRKTRGIKALENQKVLQEN